MSGGAWEYVMGYTVNNNYDGSGITSLYSNFFSDTTYTKYWDRYTATANTNYNNRILGDATGEMGPFGDKIDPDGNARHKSSWYNEFAHFMALSYPWFFRGGNLMHGTHVGNFAFSNDAGQADNWCAFRIVLTPMS